jgi:hypothetical protein
MDDTATSPGIGRGDAHALEEPLAEMSETERSRTNRARRYSLVGVGLFALAWLLGGIGTVQGLAIVVPYADMSLGLGFVLAFLGASLAGASLWEFVPLGALSGVGHFYKGQDHATHILSGWGFSLDHTAHIVFGLVLIGAATVAAAVLAFYHTRSSRLGSS